MRCTHPGYHDKYMLCGEKEIQTGSDTEAANSLYGIDVICSSQWHNLHFVWFLHLLYISLTACVSGFFKAAQGDHKCLQCPINSRTTSEGATNCVCRNGYYRTDSDPAQMPCTSTCAQTAMNISAPAANENLSISEVSKYHINISCLHLQYVSVVFLRWRVQKLDCMMSCTSFP